MDTITANELDRIERRRLTLREELDDFCNVTKARRIKINIELDFLANRERKLTQV